MTDDRMALAQLLEKHCFRTPQDTLFASLPRNVGDGNNPRRH
jgi:hypothetical protein